MERTALLPILAADGALNATQGAGRQPHAEPLAEGMCQGRLVEHVGGKRGIAVMLAGVVDSGLLHGS